MARPRTFDHAAAQALAARGLRTSEIARRLGVSWKAAKRATDPEYARADNEIAKLRIMCRALVKDGLLEYGPDEARPSSRGVRYSKTYQSNSRT